MTVTKIEQTAKSKYRIYLEGEFAFVLYKGELSRFHIYEGAKLSEVDLELIQTEIILKRVKRKALYLLNLSDRTEEELRKKLEKEEYPTWAVEKAIAYVKSFGYVDDDRYIENFIRSKKEKESKKSICAKLVQKGLNMEKIRTVMDTCFEEETEETAIENLLRKKGFTAETADRKEKQKIAAFLARKGFSYAAIRKSVQWDQYD